MNIIVFTRKWRFVCAGFDNFVLEVSEVLVCKNTVS